MIKWVSCGSRFTHKEGIHIERPEGAGNYAFVFFRSRAEVQINGRVEQAEPNSYILFSPSSAHAYRDLEKPFINDWIHCEEKGLKDWLEYLRFPVDQLMTSADPVLIPRCVLELQHTEREVGPYRDEIMDLELRSLFAKLANGLVHEAAPARTNRYAESLAQLRSELYGSPDARVSVESLAARLRLSKSYFQHLYKELFGCSVVTDMIRGRVEYAKYLLGSTRLSVGEIGRLCGYENETHFMRQFKQTTSVTPSAYRKGKY
ncbi:helix-turn-helix domain-containing protein [Saccharibacillus sacchari]|uniref:helix-turn-helix domain-containing protein n=1 Tax=Saccharibacillus sacchari TaxID=456493 RepID=UPI0004AE0614|nr:AraC family transcriptional regulator [Saccharibacillus sacchari]